MLSGCFIVVTIFIGTFFGLLKYILSFFVIPQAAASAVDAEDTRSFLASVILLKL